MSLEEETVQLSLAYHGLREENEELKALLKDYYQLFLELPAVPYGGRQFWIQKSAVLQQRAEKLLKPVAGE